MAVESTYRDSPLEDLQALRLSTLIQIKNIEGVGQKSSLNGRNTEHASLTDLTKQLININAAIKWKRTNANRGNNGYASRLASYNGQCCE